ncbi:protein adenylyltransferase SelO [Marinospirillum perlucidum]|uniref:protein adenylyltransferase SelO n=1 Tax=Marinospirillum perlucidum TaxID=1982602 RepID=UPI000DF1B62A|nr:YdiU family protein [Marinospirillum perlucidum]
MSALTDWHQQQRFCHLPDRFYQQRQPEVFPGPSALVAFSVDAAVDAGLDPCHLDQRQLLDWMTGRWHLPGSQPLAMKYAGHQFGYFNPALGDGRGLLLTEVKNSQGQAWEVHLKGAGRTAFSRFGDGRAVLRSCIREFLGSEALHHLGIPTTRALAIATTGEGVRRERLEPGATLLRLTPSHLRIGHFEHFFFQQDIQGLQILLDFTLEEVFPKLLAAPDPAAALFNEVLQRNARLVARWQALGFCHGVLNSDNISLLGETLDYGPFAFLDFYQPGFVGNHTDELGRYAFNRQAGVMHWNLACLARALSPLVAKEELQASLNRFPAVFEDYYRAYMADRLGLDVKESWPLVERFLALCEAGRLDWTRLLRLLSEDDQQAVRDIFAQAGPGVSQEAVTSWWQAWGVVSSERFTDRDQRQEFMCRHNPVLLPRTHLLQGAIDQAESGDFSEVNRLLACFRTPYSRKGKRREDSLSPAPSQQGLALSCSS